MEPDLPTTHPRATLVDLLDRVLDKGVFLQADLIISMAGIPLIGARLSVALAGMETMLRYGIMSDWDQAIRAGADQEQELHAAASSLKERPNKVPATAMVA